MAGDIKIGDMFGGLFDLAGEFIEDKDKRNEFNLKAKELQNNLQIAIITQKTSPKVDAAVKLMYALSDCVKSLWRPLGSVCMTGFAIYAYCKGINIDPTVNAMLTAAFPGWMTSRHMEKQKKKKWWNPFD